MAKSSDAAEVWRAHRSELSPLRFLERSVLVYPGKVAVVHEDRRYTYREFGERVNRLASALRAAGLRKGDRVAFICPNIPAKPFPKVCRPQVLRFDMAAGSRTLTEVLNEFNIRVSPFLLIIPHSRRLRNCSFPRKWYGQRRTR